MTSLSLLAGRTIGWHFVIAYHLLLGRGGGEDLPSILMAILGPLKYMYLQPDVKALFDKVKATVLIKMDHLTKILVQRTCQTNKAFFDLYNVNS